MSKKIVSIIGLAVSALFIFYGVFFKVPDKKISLYGSVENGGYTEYVGGDAYNIQIEASLRAGEIAGAKAVKAILITVGGMIAVISLFGFAEEDRNIPYEIKGQVYEIKRQVEEIKKSITEIEKTCKDFEPAQTDGAQLAEPKELGGND